ncbi:MAG: ABC transporter substrate-binding protein [Lachnospiraceae bacterium]|nr:ABC transporter substrate-binding protein [Lachnospiraceae bacterium]
MKKYRVLLSLLITFTIVLCLSACENKNGDNKLVREGKLTMATNAYFPPYEHYSGDEIVGIDIDIGKLIADRMGLDLEIKDMPFEDVINSVKDGESDIAISTLTVTEERQKIVDFTEPYAFGIQSIIVKEDSEIKNAEDLYNAEMIGVQKGATGEAFCQEDFGEEKVTSYNKISVSLLDLNTGKIDAVVIDRDVAEKYVEENAGLKMLDSDYKKEDYGIAISKDNPKLKEEINKILQELKDEGKIDEIIGRHITGDME